MIDVAARARRPTVPILLALLVVAVFPATMGAAAHVHAPSAPAAVTVKLHPVGNAKVSGAVTLAASGTTTIAVVSVHHLSPHARPYAVIHAGVCSDLKHLSASSLFMPALKEDAQGTANGSGRVHGPDAGGWNQNVKLSALVRFGDVIVIYTRAGLVACGNIV